MPTDTVLIYAGHRTDAWWMHVGDNLGIARAVVVSDIRGAGHCDVVDDFYAAYRTLPAAGPPRKVELDKDEVADVIARCRLLRWLPLNQAQRMVASMESAFVRVLDRVRPVMVLGFPIDRYVTDVLERLARKRGLPYLELTASLISGMCMLMSRGQLVKTGDKPSPELLEQHVRTIAHPQFTPVYVQRDSVYSEVRWLKIFFKFKVRGLFFKAFSLAKRDPLNLHYLDAQSWLGHKPRLADRAVLSRVNWQWRDKLGEVPLNRRVFFGLQLFPEASIDYWIANRQLIDYENLVFDAAKAFASAGWLVLVKDHPSQFGFRQRDLIERLLSLSNVTLVPYDVSGNEVMAVTGANFTLTGTLGLQAALLGRTSITTPTYYKTEADFLTFERRDMVNQLPAMAAAWTPAEPLPHRQARMLSHLLEGSFNGDFFSFRGFDTRAPNPEVARLARQLGAQLAAFLKMPLPQAEQISATYPQVPGPR